MHLTIQASEENVVIYTLLSLGRQIEMRETRSVVEHRTIDSPELRSFETFTREIWIKTNGHPARLVRRHPTVGTKTRVFIAHVAARPHADYREEFNQLFTTLTHHAI